MSLIIHKSGEINFEDLQSEKSYSAQAAYGQSKLACLLFAYVLQRGLETSSPYQFEIFHFDELDFWKNLNHRSTVFLLLGGVLLIQFLYFLVLFVINREKIYLYLSIALFGFFFTIAPILPALSWLRNFNNLTIAGFFLALIGLIKYSETFLNLRQLSINWYRPFRVYFL